MSPSGLLAWFWAKLGTNTWPESYHPVVCHLIDVGQVASLLWERVTRPQVRAWVCRRLGLGSEIHAGAWLAFWVAAHDIGKVAPCFQDRRDRTQELRCRLMVAGFDFPGLDNPHGDIGTRVLAEELAQQGRPWPGIETGIAQAIAVAVGGHHGIFPEGWDEIEVALGNERWAHARREIMALLAQFFGVGDLPAPCPPANADQAIWLYLAGLTSVADWVGSNVHFFPPVGNARLPDQSFDLNSYFSTAENQAANALTGLGWLGREATTVPLTLQQLLPASCPPRPLQTAIESLVAGMDVPGMLIVEAPMGEGKTEAAWFAAAAWERRGGQGTYVALPTMATSNQMFERVTRFLDSEPGKKNLMLQHGKAALNEAFEQLRFAAQIYDEEKQPSAVVAESWFAANKKHGLLAPYGVGTIDQALLAVLLIKHQFVRLFGLAGKCVILDEIHAYDAYTTTLLEQLLRWLAALGCPVVLLSATLPREKRLQLLRAYGGKDTGEPEAVPYPRVTSVVPGRPAEARPVVADPSRARTVDLGWLAEEKLSEQLQRSLADGGCGVVIRNTVGLAQQTFCQLREHLTPHGIQVELFHARFPFGQRQEIEDSVLHRFGKQGLPGERHKRVLVATQVVEQSLDLDFDVMVSDVAPVDLVLQRAGRLHRHARGERPQGVRQTRLWLIEPATSDGIPTFGHSEFVYARYVLVRSYLALKATPHIQLPDDLERFIEQVYGNEALAIPDACQCALAESRQTWQTTQDQQTLDALQVALADPDRNPLEQRSLLLEEDDPDAARRIQAQTRDADPSIQLILIYHIEGRDYLDAAASIPFVETSSPTRDQIRALFANEVTLNQRGCVAFYARKPTPTSWRAVGLLRHHRLVRLDRAGNSLPKEFPPLRLDRELGVVL